MSNTTANEAMTEEKRIDLLATLLMSQPWVLVVCGLGDIKGEDLAKHLLKLRKGKYASHPNVSMI